MNELITVRNKLSHNEPFTWEDAARALDSMYRLLVAAGAEVEAEHLGKMRDEILRRKFRSAWAGPGTPHGSAFEGARAERPKAYTDFHTKGV